MAQDLDLKINGKTFTVKAAGDNTKFCVDGQSVTYQAFYDALDKAGFNPTFTMDDELSKLFEASTAVLLQKNLPCA